jgi:hypothetical protein
LTIETSSREVFEDAKRTPLRRQSPGCFLVVLFLDINHIPVVSVSVRHAGGSVDIDSGVEKPSMNFGKRS